MESAPRQEGNQMHAILAQRVGTKRNPAGDGARRSSPAPAAATASPAAESPEEWSKSHHAETEDAPRRSEAIQEDGHREVHPGAAFKRHILTSKTTKRKRALRGSHAVSEPDQDRIARMLPYK